MASRVQGQRLNTVLQRMRETNTPNAITRLEEPDTVNLKKRARPKRPHGRRSADALLIDYIMPLISNPSIFQDHHVIMILEHLRDVVLPSIVDNAELADIAVKMLNDEVFRHKLVQERRLTEMAS